MSQHGEAHQHDPHEHGDEKQAAPSRVQAAIHVMQQYSLPLITGVVLALVWSNINHHSYHSLLEHSLTGGVSMLDHSINLHFLVNDIFMCFFFALAMKEVTTSLLPGGALSPLRKAVNPLMATFGGVAGPAVMYVGLVLVMYSMGAFSSYQCSSGVAVRANHHRLLMDTPAYQMTARDSDYTRETLTTTSYFAVEAGEAFYAHDGLGRHPGEVPMETCSLATLIKGWGVPTATDISLSWMFAVRIFGEGHPAVNFLLLLAIVDDAIGMVIIAIFYPDPERPVEPIYLALVGVAMAIALAFRYLRVPCWFPYIFICGPIAWFGLLQAHVHPALALCFVVPLMPACLPDRGDHEGEETGVEEARELAKGAGSAGGLSRWMAQFAGHHAPLDAFEHCVKLPVDLGMFFFGLANAGVQLNVVGTLTVAVFVALVLGKTLGITAFGMLAQWMGFPLPEGVTPVDLVAMGAVGGIGLTVALFVANEAFVDESLQGQAKFAAVLSVLSAGLSWAIKRFGDGRGSKHGEADAQPEVVGKALEEDPYAATKPGELTSKGATKRLAGVRRSRTSWCQRCLRWGSSGL